MKSFDNIPRFEDLSPVEQQLEREWQRYRRKLESKKKPKKQVVPKKAR